MSVLDRPQDDHQLLEQRARSLARPLEEVGAATSLHVVVRIGGHPVSIPATQLRQVSAVRSIMEAPSSFEAVVGIVVVHGQVLAAVDLATVLGLPSAVPLRDRAAVVVEDGGDGTALLVDSVDGLDHLTDVGPETTDGPSGVITRTVDAGPRRLCVEALLASLDGPPPPLQPATPGGMQ